MAPPASNLAACFRTSCAGMPSRLAARRLQVTASRKPPVSPGAIAGRNDRPRCFRYRNIRAHISPTYSSPTPSKPES